jgi:hypothetical protein
VLVGHDSQDIDRFSYGRRHDTSVVIELTIACGVDRHNSRI